MYNMNQFVKAAKKVAAAYNSVSLILRIAIGLVVGAFWHWFAPEPFGWRNWATCLSAH